VLMGEMPQNGKAMEADTLALGHIDMKRYWTGDIHSIRFYDRELADYEVALNAEADAVNYSIGRLTPETTIPETTAAPETTKAPETTAAPETTKAPETTQAPTTNAPTTDKAPEKKGCGAAISGSAIIMAAILAVPVIVRRKRK